MTISIRLEETCRKGVVPVGSFDSKIDDAVQWGTTVGLLRWQLIPQGEDLFSYKLSWLSLPQYYYDSMCCGEGVDITVSENFMELWS